MSKEDEKIIFAFGQVLKRKRLELGVSQEKLAFNIESHFTHISRLENGHKQPTLVMIFKLSRELGISPHDLIAEVEKEADEKIIS